VLPAVTVALLAIAYLQDDGLLLAVSFVVGILSLVVFGLLVWTSAAALENLLVGCCTCLGRNSENAVLGPPIPTLTACPSEPLRPGCIVKVA
jgi:hypothetical protein